MFSTDSPAGLMASTCLQSVLSTEELQAIPHDIQNKIDQHWRKNDEIYRALKVEHVKLQTQSGQ